MDYNLVNQYIEFLWLAIANVKKHHRREGKCSILHFVFTFLKT